MAISGPGPGGPDSSEVFTHSAWPDFGEFGPRGFYMDCTNSVQDLVTNESVDFTKSEKRVLRVLIISNSILIRQIWKIRLLFGAEEQGLIIVSFQGNLAIFTYSDSSVREVQWSTVMLYLLIGKFTPTEESSGNILILFWAIRNTSKTYSDQEIGLNNSFV